VFYHFVVIRRNLKRFKAAVYHNANALPSSATDRNSGSNASSSSMSSSRSSSESSDVDSDGTSVLSENERAAPPPDVRSHDEHRDEFIAEDAEQRLSPALNAEETPSALTVTAEPSPVDTFVVTDTQSIELDSFAMCPHSQNPMSTVNGDENESASDEPQRSGHRRQKSKARTPKPLLVQSQSVGLDIAGIVASNDNGCDFGVSLEEFADILEDDGFGAKIDDNLVERAKDDLTGTLSPEKRTEHDTVGHCDFNEEYPFDHCSGVGDGDDDDDDGDVFKELEHIPLTQRIKYYR